MRIIKKLKHLLGKQRQRFTRSSARKAVRMSDRCPLCGKFADDQPCSQCDQAAAPSFIGYDPAIPGADRTIRHEPERREEPRGWTLMFVATKEGGRARSIKSGPMSDASEVVDVIERSAYDELQANYSTVTREWHELHTELATLKRELEELEVYKAKFVEVRHLNSDLTAENAKLKEQIEDDERRVFAHADENKRTFDQLRRELAEAKAFAERETQRKIAAWSERDEARADVERLRGQLAERESFKLANRYRTALERISGRPMSYETAKRIADEALEEKANE
jgi:hypothetical protein